MQFSAMFFSQSKSLQRLKYEGLDTSPEIIAEGGKYFNDPSGFAMHKFACIFGFIWLVI